RRGGRGGDERRRGGRGGDERRRGGPPRAGDETRLSEETRGGKGERPRGDHLTLRVKIERVGGDEPRGKSGAPRQGPGIREDRAAERRPSEGGPARATERPHTGDDKQRPGLLARILGAFRR